LLLEVQGPTCWEDLRTVNGQLYPTFYEAAVAQNLMAGEDMWARTVRDAMLQYRQLRQRIYWFGNFLMRVQPPEPMQLIQNNLQFLAPPQFQTSSQHAAAMNYILKRLEMLFRRSGLVATNQNSAGTILGLDNVFIDTSNALNARIEVIAKQCQINLYF
jgi:hypothetical protein